MDGHMYVCMSWSPEWNVMAAMIGVIKAIG